MVALTEKNPDVGALAATLSEKFDSEQCVKQRKELGL